VILALRALGLGDLLTGVPALRALRRGAGGARLALACPPALADLARVACGIDEVVPLDAVRGFDGVAADALPRSDLAVNLHGRGPQSSALLRSSGAGRVVAFGIDAEWRDDEHERERWCRLLAESGVVDAGDADPLDLRVDVEPDERFAGAVVVHPGASAPSRQWPVERWRAVAGALGRRIVVTGSAAERELAAAVAAGIGESVAGRTDVVGLLRLAAAADLVLCGDTGMAHVASAVGTPSVVLFGPVSPARWGPPTGGPHVALWHGREGDPHGPTTDDGLLAISVDEVVAAARVGDQRRSWARTKLAHDRSSSTRVALASSRSTNHVAPYADRAPAAGTRSIS
jgi:ADP-heptose:LPS heptosyltransferase